MEDVAWLNWNWVKRRWFELRIGHTQYLAFFLSFTNFLLIAYNFLVANLVAVDLVWFGVFAVLCYAPLAVYAGHLHKRKQMETDVTVQFKPILERLDRIERMIEENG